MNVSIGIMTGNGGELGSTQAAREVLEAVGDFTFREGLIGQAAIEDSGDPLPRASRQIVRASHAVLLGPLVRPGSESDDDSSTGPHAGATAEILTRTMDARAYVQPVRGFDGVADLSPLAGGRSSDIDLVLVHALDGIHSKRGGQSPESGFTYDRFEYSKEQIRDVGRIAFDLARIRADHTLQQPEVMSMDKSNVMDTSRSWREVMEALVDEEYMDVRLTHMLADNAAMEIAGRPHKLDVVVGDHLFGGISRGITAGLTAPGLVPSAYLNLRRRGIFAPARPEGQDNAYGSILSAAALLRYSVDMPGEAERIEAAVGQALSDGLRTPDMGGEAAPEEVTEAVLGNLRTG